MAGARRVKDTRRKQLTEPTKQAMQWLTETELTNTDPDGSELGPMHVLRGCVSSCARGTLTSGSGGRDWEEWREGKLLSGHNV